jgi:group I intron endonuclease
MENFVYIYALEYPFGNIRYVGKSKNPNRRFKRHIQDAQKYSSSHKLAWIRSLLNIGKIPCLYIIDKVPENEWEFWEQYYIRECEIIGFKLTNGTRGGDGNHNPSNEVREKISSSLLNYFREHNAWNKGKTGISFGYPKGKSRSTQDAFLNSKRKRELYKSRKPWNFGKKMSLEQREKLSISRSGISPIKRKIVQYDLSGNKLCEWECMRDAINTLGLSRKTLKKCLIGRFENDGKFIWKYKEETN